MSLQTDDGRNYVGFEVCARACAIFFSPSRLACVTLLRQMNVLLTAAVVMTFGKGRWQIHAVRKLQIFIFQRQIERKDEDKEEFARSKVDLDFFQFRIN